MSELPLCGPPNYEYSTTGPWWVIHVPDEGKAQAWTMWTFESAVMRFWLCETQPPRRLMIDVNGVTVLDTEIRPDGRRTMVGTREVMEQTLDMVRRMNNMIESEAEVLAMIETVRSMDGQAF